MSDHDDVITKRLVSFEQDGIQRVDKIMRRMESIQNRLHSIASRLKEREGPDEAACREMEEFIMSLDEAYIELSNIDRSFNRKAAGGLSLQPEIAVCFR